MELSGSRIIKADRQAVWDHLNDAATLRACIPGCETLEGNASEGFEAVVKQKVGPVKATFKGAVTIENPQAPSSYTLRGEGKGGVAGFAKGSAEVTLNETDEGTELSYTVDAKVGGKLAQLGNRVVGGFARKMADQFFEAFQAEVEDNSA